VIAPRAGGALDTVMDGVTGLLLDDPSADAFAEAIRDTRFGDTWTAAAVGHAQRFSVARFQTALHNVVADVAGHPRRERPATAVESPVLVAG
jgi:glycosyltransferase involved in cell wall biosynthesis